MIFSNFDLTKQKVVAYYVTRSRNAADPAVSRVLFDRSFAMGSGSGSGRI
jgi:hypothetical protein